MNTANWLKKLGGLFNRHVENICDGFALVVNLESLSVVTSPVAHFTGNVYVGQKVHLNGDCSVPGAVFAAPTLDVETESTGLIATNFCFGSFGKEVSNLVEDSCIGCGV